METIGQRVIAARLAKKWRQSDLVRESKIPQSTIASIEGDKRTSEPSAILIDLAHLLDVSAYWLKTGKGQRSPSQLSNEEQRLLAGFRLLGREAQEMWLMAADAKIAEADKQTKVA